jgi:putative PIN family toxin of toxin-antitoxin system
VRAIVDTNVFVSYLLGSDQSDTIEQVLRFVAEGQIQLTLPPEQIQELQRVVTNKPFLRARIGLEKLERFLGLLDAIGESLPPIVGDPPRVLRDRKDDFLIESAKQDKVDLIISAIWICSNGNQKHQVLR